MPLIRTNDSEGSNQSPPPPYQSYLVTASVNDLNLNSNYIQSKMDFERGLSPNGNGGRLDDAATTSRSIDIPVPSLSPSNPRLGEKKYWKLSFRIVLLPLLLLGIPAHLVLMKRQVKSKEDWFRALVNCGNLGLTLFSLFIGLLSLSLNVYVLRNIVEVFDILIIRGDLNPNVMINLVNLVQNLPIIIPMTFIWIWGKEFNRRNLNRKFKKD